MDLNKLLKVPFPSPKRSTKKFLSILFFGVLCSLFILLFNPFYIAEQAGELWVTILLFSLGIVFSLSIIFMEWVVPWLLPHFFRNWNIGKGVLWYTLVFIIAGTIIFFYKSYLAGYQDFKLSELLFVLFRTITISLTVAFFLVGIYQFFFTKNKISEIVVGETITITTSDSKNIKVNLSHLLFLSSDDNYVEIHFLDKDVRKKLIVRSSLKHLKQQLINPISPIQQCHRQYLINIKMFSIVYSSSRSLKLQLKNFDDIIPVSAPYVKSIKKGIAY